MNSVRHQAPYRRRAAVVAAATTIFVVPDAVRADEGGGSFWVPGQVASFAAQPPDPGFSLLTTVYVSSGTASADRPLSRGANIVAGHTLNQYLVFVNPSYAFEDLVLGGRLSLGASFTVGRSDVTASVLESTRRGARSSFQSDSMTAAGDIAPMASLSWNVGNHNFETYATANVPVGAYDPSRLAGLGLGFWAIDGGVAYTFANSAGLEFSVTTGLTYNFMNQSTQYQSGVAGHVDWGASVAINDALYVGAAGYFYQQASPDGGPGAKLGPYLSRVAGVGPQIGYSLDLGVVQANLNLRGYGEFGAENRPEGWNVWFTVTLSKFRPRGKQPS
jgi:hypothetical protein